jgi:hypothetical protein
LEGINFDFEDSGDESTPLRPKFAAKYAARQAAKAQASAQTPSPPPSPSTSTTDAQEPRALATPKMVAVRQKRAYAAKTKKHSLDVIYQDSDNSDTEDSDLEFY